MKYYIHVCFWIADARIFIIEKLATVIFSPLKEITHSITDHLHSKLKFVESTTTEQHLEHYKDDKQRRWAPKDIQSNFELWAVSTVTPRNINKYS